MAGIMNFYNATKMNYKTQNDALIAQVTPLLEGLTGKYIFENEKKKANQKGIAEKKAVAGAMGVADTALPAGIETPEGAEQVLDYKAKQIALAKTTGAMAQAYGIDTTKIDGFDTKSLEEQNMLVEKAIKDNIQAKADAKEVEKDMRNFEQDKQKMAIQHGYQMEEIYGRATATGAGNVKLTDTQKNALSKARETVTQFKSTGKTVRYGGGEKAPTGIVKIEKAYNGIPMVVIADGKLANQGTGFKIAVDGNGAYWMLSAKGWVKKKSSEISSSTRNLLATGYGEFANAVNTIKTHKGDNAPQQTQTATTDNWSQYKE